MGVAAKPVPQARATRRRPARLGFVGLGWIGWNRCEAVVKSGLARSVAFCDGDATIRERVGGLAPGCVAVESLGELLSLELDGIVIATPTRLHAAQAIEALNAGLPVFCQKPLGRNACETRAVVEAARRADRLLDVDFCYRRVRGVATMASMVREQIGRTFAVDLVFHNAYGPDKPWYYDRPASGGGCLMDLGVHLVDLLFWVTGCKEVSVEAASVLQGGRPVGAHGVEDFAAAHLRTDNGACVRLACSWRLPAGRDALIEASFYGTEGGASLRNVGGSFYDFQVEHYRGTSRQRLARPPDAWGGRGITRWVRQLIRTPRFDRQVQANVRVAGVIDEIYERSAGGSKRPEYLIH